MTFLLSQWKLIAIAILACMILFMRERINNYQNQLDAIDKQRKAYALQVEKDVARTNSQYVADLKRARSSRVGVPNRGTITSQGLTPPPGSDQNATVCFTGGEFYTELSGISQRNAERLTEITAGIAERAGRRLSTIAQQQEELAAAYRGCKAFGEGL